MALWTIGDLHLSLGTEKPMDVFGDKWKNHDQKIQSFWQQNVLPDDTIIIAGDTSWAIGLDELLPDLLFLHSLPGRKILLKGNHDYWWQTLKKMQEFLKLNEIDDLFFLQNDCYQYDNIAVCGTRGWLLEGEDSEKMINRECKRLELSLQSAPEKAEKIVFFHFPPLCPDIVCKPFIDLMQSYGVKSCYYGHLHGPSIKNAVTGEHFGINFSLVSADSLDFCLQNIYNK